MTDQELKEIEKRRNLAKELSKSAPYDEIESTNIDPENPPLTKDQLNNLRPAHEVIPDFIASKLRKEGDKFIAGPFTAKEAAKHARIDKEKVAAFTEEEIHQHAIEDGNSLRPGSRLRRPVQKRP